MTALLELFKSGTKYSKRGANKEKAFLTEEGKKIVKNRKKDFQFLFLIKNSNSYIFSSQPNHHQILSLETMRREISRGIRSVSKILSNQPKLNSHRFRIDYISELWNDSKSIEFGKQYFTFQTTVKNTIFK